MNYIKGVFIMSENIKLYSEMERYEIINVNDGNKFNCLGNNDVIIDDDGKLNLLVLNGNTSKFGLFSKSEFTEMPWEYVKKIGAKTIIIDVEEKILKKSR
jgi:YlmC/YmxH family sporulation protein